MISLFFVYILSLLNTFWQVTILSIGLAYIACNKQNALSLSFNARR